MRVRMTRVAVADMRGRIRDRTVVITAEFRVALAAGFELDGDVPDTDPGHFTLHPPQHAGVRREVGDDGMRAHGNEAAGDGPDVQVVDAAHAVNGDDAPLDVAGFHVGGHAIEQDHATLAHQAPGARRISTDTSTEMIGSTRVQPV